MMRGINRTEDVYSHLLQNMVRWLETTQSESLVRVHMDKTQYSYGDPLDMIIEVYDENLNAVNNADINISLVSRSEKREFSPQPQNDGTYHAALQAPSPGDYQAIVTATSNGQPLGEETVLFSVGEYSAELADIQARPAVLQSLSRATGGISVTHDSLAILSSSIHGEATTTPITLENELWNNKYILFAILFFLVLEWTLRKRRGMV